MNLFSIFQFYIFKPKWISADSLGIVFNAHVHLKLIVGVISLWSFWQKWNVISGDKISCKHYPKWNAFSCPSKYWFVLKCSRNEMSCEKNLFPRRFEISNWCEFISRLMWTYSITRKLSCLSVKWYRQE